MKRLLLISSIPQKAVSLQESKPSTLLLFSQHIPCLPDASEHRMWPCWPFIHLGILHLEEPSKVLWWYSHPLVNASGWKRLPCSSYCDTHTSRRNTFCFQTLRKQELFGVSEQSCGDSHFWQCAHFSRGCSFSQSLHFSPKTWTQAKLEIPLLTRLSRPSLCA